LVLWIIFIVTVVLELFFFFFLSIATEITTTRAAIVAHDTLYCTTLSSSKRIFCGKALPEHTLHTQTGNAIGREHFHLVVRDGANSAVATSVGSVLKRGSQLS
jgi:hypothetical protein